MSLYREDARRKRQMNKPDVYLFVDGSCGPSQDIGAWAALVVTASGRRKILYGTAYPTTISRCELIPIMEGLRWISKELVRFWGVRLRVYSDSEYTVKTLNGLYEKEHNTELWAAVDEVVRRSGLQIEYVYRERNSHPYMELCDAVCTTLRHGGKNIAAALFGLDPKEPEASLPVAPLPDEIPDPEEAR